MTRILDEKYYDGAREKIERLGLGSLIDEIRLALQSFDLLIRNEPEAI